jgi:hypothetical protein
MDSLSLFDIYGLFCISDFYCFLLLGSQLLGVDLGLPLVISDRVVDVNREDFRSLADMILRVEVVDLTEKIFELLSIFISFGLLLIFCQPCFQCRTLLAKKRGK